MSYYAVKKGYSTGVFDKWSDCQNAISGFSGAEFKKFNTEEEANAFLEDRDIWKEKVDSDLAEGFLVAFTDGSYEQSLQRYSFGALLITPDNNEYELCGYASNPKYISSRNIPGEMLGVINAMDWAVSNSFEKIRIYHDYEGLPKWISGEWNADSDAAKMFCAIYRDKYADLLQVDFEKVKGHSNNAYNDRVDSLAKSALYDRKWAPVEGENWFCIPHFRKGDFEALLDLVKEVDANIQVTNEVYPLRTIYRLKLGTNKLTVTYFNSGNHKLLVQGIPSILFQIVVAILNESEDITCETVLSNAYRKKIDKSKIDDVFNTTIPSLPPNYPTNNSKLIRQAIINLQYYIESEDYAQYAFPALRALEGHIKYLIIEAGGTVGRSFSCFNKDAGGQYIYSGAFSSISQKSQIEKCYRYYKSQRDTLFHFGDLMGSTDTTRLVSSKAEADEIIKKCIGLICEL